MVVAVIAVFIFVVTGNIMPQQNQVSLNQEKQVVKDDSQQKATTTADEKNNQEQEKEFVCGIIKNENGLKTYRNEYWGIEFSFMDEEGDLKVGQGCKSAVVISKNSGDFWPYIYIGFLKEDFNRYSNLKEYLNKWKGWDQYQEAAELISIKEIKNNNDLTFIETIANVSGGGQSSGYYKSKNYYIEYNKIKDKNYISIFGPGFNSLDLHENFEYIIDTFKFID